MRTLSAAAKRSIFAQQTDIVWLFLLTISHSTLDTPIRVVNNAVNIVSRDNEYVAFPFTIDLPQEREDAPPSVRLIIDNVDRSIIAAIRDMESAPSIRLEVVTSSNYDIVEVGPFDFELRQVDYNALTIEGDLSFEPILDEPWPARTFSPIDFPGLF